MFSSFFSSYVDGHSLEWFQTAAGTALELLENNDGRPRDGWLLEIAFHGSLSLSGSTGFYRKLARIEQALQRYEQKFLTRSSQYVKGLLAYAHDDLDGAERPSPRSLV
jgi:hypothetical protein